MTGTVNKRTGVFQADLPIAYLNGNAGQGPTLDLYMRYPSVGGLSWCEWDLRINHIVCYEEGPTKYDFLLTNTERFQTDSIPVYLPGLTVTESTFKNENIIQINYKDGSVEYYTSAHTTTIKNRNATIYVLTEKRTETGYSLSVEWKIVDGIIQLLLVKDNTYDLLHTRYAKNSEKDSAPLTFIKYPNTTDVNFIELETLNSRLSCKKISGNKTEITYNKALLVSKIKYPFGLTETITYTNDNRVEKHSLSTENREPDISSKYEYNKESSTTTITEEMDNPITTTYHYDGFGNQTKEVRTQGDCIYTTESIKTFPEITSNKLQYLTKTTYTKGKNSRTEEVLTEFDEDGNIIRIEKDGIITEFTYYKGMETETYTKTEYAYSNGILQSIIRGMTIRFPLTEDIPDILGITRSIVRRDISNQTPIRSNYGKLYYNLPINIECPENPNLFKVYLESEKTYSKINNVRKDLKWTFYGYKKVSSSKLPYGEYAIKLAHVGTIHNPISDDTIKLKSWEGMIVQGIDYYENDELYSGRVKKQVKTIIDANAVALPLATHSINVTYGQQNSIKDNITTSIQTSTLIAKTPEGKNINSKQSKSTFTGDLLSTEDSNGTKTEYTYDAIGRLTQKKDFTGDKILSSVTNFTYRALESSIQVEMKNISGDKYRNTFDGLGRPIESEYENPESNIWLLLSKNTYDAVGRVKSSHEYDYTPDGKQLIDESWTFEYDDWGNHLKTITKDGLEHISSYEPLIRQYSNGIQWPLRYSGYTNHLINSPDGGRINEEYFYVNDTPVGSRTLTTDISGRLIKETSSFSPPCQYEYDRYQRVTSLTIGDTVTTNHYPDHTSAPIATAAWIHKKGADIKGPEHFGSGLLGTRLLDSTDRVINTTIGGRTQTYTYEGNSQWGKMYNNTSIQTTTTPISASYSSKTREFTEFLHGKQSTICSLKGLPLQTTDAFNNITTYKYGDLGLIKEASGKKFKRLLTHDEYHNQTIESVTDNTNKKTIYITYEYDSLGRESSRAFTIYNLLEFKIKRTYHPGGSLASVEKTERGVTISLERYTYTPAGQLDVYTCEGTLYPKDKDDASIKRQKFTYDYRDGLANTTTITTTDKTEIRAYHHPEKTDYSQLGSIFLAGNPGTDEYTATHDSQGRLTQLNNDQFEYNGAGQLGSHKRGDKTYTYAYDSIGRVVGCSGPDYEDKFYYQNDYQYARHGHFLNNGTKTLRISTLLNESNSCVLQEQLLLPDNQVAHSTYSFELKDADGSLVASYNLSNDQITYFSYTPFGYRKIDFQSRSWLGINAQPIDRVSGNYHLGNGVRVYNPSIQVFHSPDDLSPFGSGGAHTYSYCNNDPINYSDPSGYSPIRHSYENVSVLHHAYIDRPYVQNVVWGGTGIALALVTGGSSLSWTVGAVGLAIASAGLGVASEATEDNHSELSRYLAWGSFGTGLASGGAGMRSATRVTEASIAKATGMPAGRVRTFNFNTASRHNNATVQYELYSGGRQVNRLMIDSHGAPRFAKHRFNLPANTEMRFYSAKGQAAVARYSLFRAQLAGAVGTHIHPAGAMGVPDYLLTEFDSNSLLRLGIIQSVATLKTEYAQYATKYGVDLLRPIQGEIPLSELVSDLHNKGIRYTYIDGNFCRGSFAPSTPSLLVKVGRKFGLHYL